ncbi:MAG: glycosyltransferase family 2 protein [Anaerolineales bacterium]
MPDLPRVTIITPSFNQGIYLEKTICSVLEQDYSNLEYMVVDGGSSDDSLDIIRQYEHRLAWWVSEKDRGQSDAINKGLARASGEIVAWLNSDDFYLPGAVKSAVAALKEHPDWGLVYGDMLAVDGKGALLNIQRFGDWGLNDLMCFRILGQPSVFLRKSVLDRAGSLDTRFHYLLDHHLWIRIAMLSPIGHIPQFLAAARFHATAKNVAKASSFGEDAYAIVRWMQTQPELVNRFRRLRRSIWAGAHWINARYLSEGGMPEKSLQAFWRSFQCDPRVVLRDWRRLLFTALLLFGGQDMRSLYLKYRQRRQLRQLDPAIVTLLHQERQ